MLNKNTTSNRYSQITSGNDTISLPLLSPTAGEVAKKVGCNIIGSTMQGSVKEIESFMQLQNPMLQSKYNCSKYLNGRWNPHSRKLELVLTKTKVNVEKILMSASFLRSDKTVSTGFMPVVYNTFQELAEAMHIFAHSASVYSPINRWDIYKNELKWDYRRRLHNISFIGNILVYDFDNGLFTFGEAVKLLKEKSLNGLVIRSKSDPKYDYDRFKLLIQTDMFFPAYKKDEAPTGFQKVPFEKYRNIYVGLAKKYEFWEYADHSTVDPSRLIAQVNNTDQERRALCHRLIQKNLSLSGIRKKK